ncbi:hypothetical protein RRG08_050580 [Elysia crispata]|uniref:Mariner Mos1 transposase n=1 Tax=Elysia crispata TaxID=231223 RepID=A0AAE0Z8L1_9GAST|nr:hypothetical protein RRG08_050580 [Elysia crispata]
MLKSNQKRAFRPSRGNFLRRFQTEQNDFLGRIITGDETWVYSWDPETKRQSAEWRHFDEPRPKKVRRKQGALKVMHMIFFDMNGVILRRSVPIGTTINAQYYKKVLQDKLRPAIRKKRLGLLESGILFHHDNAPVHTARAVTDVLAGYKWELLEHPRYSPDLAPYPVYKDKGNHCLSYNVEASYCCILLSASPPSFFRDSPMVMTGFPQLRILAGISEIEESVTPASAEEEEGDEDREDLSSKPHRCRQRRRSSQADRSGDQSKDFEKSRDEAFKLGRADNNNLYNVGEEMLSGQSTPVSRQHRVRSTSDSRSPARPRSSTGSSSPLTTGSGPSSTCSSPRHPASHRNRKTGYPRRSLSLPNGGLSYGTDVKILYRDGHFVAVVDPQAAGSSPSTAAGGATSSSSTDLGRLTAEKDEGSPSAVSSTSSSPRRASTSSNTGPSPASVLASQILRSGSAASDAVKASMRAEILALLERGITDPKRILEEACLRSLELEPNGTAADLPISPATESAIASSTSWESAEAPMFHSLPRRRGNTRPMSVDEAQLGKFHSKSQQSLVSKAEMERRRREEVEDDGESGSPQDPGWEDRMMNLAKERSMVKRNKSFNEAMGSRVNEAVGKAMKGKTLTGQEKPANSEDDSKSVGAKARGSKGPGFIQRMLQKRRSSTQEKPPLLSIGSSSLLKASREDLAGSTVSLPQFGTSGSGQQTAPPTAQTSPGKAAGRERDTSIGRKMSLRSLFKRKNSADMSCTSVLSVTMSGGGPGATEDSGSPPIATFLNDDDIGALTNSPPTPSTVVHRRLPQRADNGEPYTVPPDDSDPLSLSYPSRSRSARAGCHTSPSPGLHAVLGRSVSQEADASLEEGGDGSPRRARSSSGRGRFQEQQTTLSPVSPSSPPSLSLSSPPSSSSSSRLLGHNSWSSSDLDVESSSEDTITSRSISPAGRSNHFQPSPTASTPIADCSFSSVSEGDETLVAVQDGLSPPVYRTLTSSPMGARRRLHRDLSPTEERARDSDPRTRLAPAGPTSASPPPSLCEENESESGPVMDTSREITSSNSNDSGIQNDVNVNSSAESIMAGVRLRQSKSPSPSSSASSRRSSAHGERPKSDTTVHWAELLEQVMGAVTRTGPTAASVSAASGAVRRRHDSGRLRRRPRPKSDIDGSGQDVEDDQFYDDDSDATDGCLGVSNGDEAVGDEALTAGSHIPESSVVDHLSATNSLGNLNITKSNDNITGQGTPATTTTTSLTRRSGRQQQNSLASSTNIPTGSYSNISGGCSVSSLAELRAPRGHVVLTQQLSSSSVLSSSSSSSSSAAATAASRDALLPAKLAKFRRTFRMTKNRTEYLFSWCELSGCGSAIIPCHYIPITPLLAAQPAVILITGHSALVVAVLDKLHTSDLRFAGVCWQVVRPRGFPYESHLNSQRLSVKGSRQLDRKLSFLFLLDVRGVWRVAIVNGRKLVRMPVIFQRGGLELIMMMMMLAPPGGSANMVRPQFAQLLGVKGRRAKIRALGDRAKREEPRLER